MKKRKTSIMMGTLMLMLGAVSLSSCASLSHIEPIGLYKVSVASAGGASVTLSKETANPGEVITVTVALKEGDRLYVTGVSAGYRVEVVDQGGGIYKFQMPSRNVEVKVETASYDLADEAHLAKLASSNLDVKGTIEIVRRVGEQETISTQIISTFIGQESTKTSIIDTEGNTVVDRTYYKGEDGLLTREFINENNEVEVIEMMSGNEKAQFSMVSNPFAKLTTEDLVVNEDGYVIEDKELLDTVPPSLIYYSNDADSLKFVPVDEKTVNFTYMADLLGSSVEDDDREATMSVTGTITLSEQGDIPHLEPYKTTQASVAVDAALDELKDNSYTLVRTVSVDGEELGYQTLYATQNELIYKEDISEDLSYYYGAQNFDDTWYYFDTWNAKAVYDLEEPFTGSVLAGQSEVLGVLFEESEVTGTYSLMSAYAANAVAAALEDAIFLGSQIVRGVTNAQILYYGIVSDLELTIANGHLVSYGYSVYIELTDSQTNESLPFTFDFEYEVSNIGKTTSPLTLTRIKPTEDENNAALFGGTFAYIVSQSEYYSLAFKFGPTGALSECGGTFINYICGVYNVSLYALYGYEIDEGTLYLYIYVVNGGYLDLLLIGVNPYNPVYGSFVVLTMLSSSQTSLKQFTFYKLD